MILADTSVWIDHLRGSDPDLARLLGAGQILIHPFVIGELASGSLRQREIILGALGEMPQATVVDDSEVLGMIERHALFSRGLGYIDAHLLASVLLTPNTTLWTRDRRLHEAAAALGVAADFVG